jgi:hypothetical protein
MLVTFCLRLACGLIGSLLILSPRQIHPRFFRVQFLTALGLVLTAALFMQETALFWLWIALGGSMAVCLLGTLSWSLEGAPAGRLLIPLTTFSLGAALSLAAQNSTTTVALLWLLAMEWSSAALLGAATTAMLMGHSYLIAPGMSLTPLLRLVALLLLATVVRAALAGVGLWFWTQEHSLGRLDDVTILLPVRWGLGFVAPLVLGVLAWQTARIRSTQSATGILYVVVIFCFLGELVSQLLVGMTRGGLIS